MPEPARPTDPSSRKDFWDGVHDSKDVDAVSWWQSVPELSLGLVDRADLGRDDPIIDVGAGWSTLVDHLVDRHYRDLTAIDLSATALNTVRARLGPAGDHVVLQVADVLDLRSGTTARSITSSPSQTNVPTTSAPSNAACAPADASSWPPSDRTDPRPAADYRSCVTPTGNWPPSFRPTSCSPPAARTM
jgi:hypothetical protein